MCVVCVRFVIRIWSVFPTAITHSQIILVRKRLRNFASDLICQQYQKNIVYIAHRCFCMEVFSATIFLCWCYQRRVKVSRDSGAKWVHGGFSCHNFNFEKVIKFARGTEIALVRLELSSHQGKESLLKTALGAIFKSLNHNHTDLCIEYTIHKYVPSPVLLQALHLATVDCPLPCPNRWQWALFEQCFDAWNSRITFSVPFQQHWNAPLCVVSNKGLWHLPLSIALPFTEIIFCGMHIC